MAGGGVAGGGVAGGGKTTGGDVAAIDMFKLVINFPVAARVRDFYLHSIVGWVCGGSHTKGRLGLSSRNGNCRFEHRVFRRWSQKPYLPDGIRFTHVHVDPPASGKTQ